MPHAPRALILIADGYDDASYGVMKGTLHRQGFDVTTAGLEAGTQVTSKDGVATAITKGPLNLNLGGYDLLAVPDGDHGEALAANKSIGNIVYSLAHKGRVLALAGAAVALLLPAAKQKTAPNPAATGTRILQGEILKGRVIAAPEALHEELEKAGAVLTENPTAQDGPVLTAASGADAPALISAAVPVAHQYRALVH